MKAAVKALMGSGGTVEQTPDAFNFTNSTGAINGTAVEKEITITGLYPGYPVTVSCSGGLIDAGTTVVSGSYGTSKDVIVSPSGTIRVRARLVASNTYYAYVYQTVFVGTGSDSWSVRTRDVDVGPNSGWSNQTLNNQVPGAYRTFSQQTITGITSGVNHRITASSSSPYNTNYQIEIENSGFITNLSDYTFFASDPITWQVKMFAGNYWKSYRMIPRLYSVYSGASVTGPTYTLNTQTPFTSSTSPVTVPSGTQHTFTITMTNLPTTDPNYAGVKVFSRPDISGGSPEFSWDGNTWYPENFTALDMNDTGAPSLSATSVTFYMRVSASTNPSFRNTGTYVSFGPGAAGFTNSAYIELTVTATF